MFGSRQFTSEVLEHCQTCSIRLTSVCSAMKEEEIGELAEITTLIKAAPQETIFYEGDPADHLFNVTGGGVSMFKLLPDGRRQITGFLFAGDFLGLALHDHYSYSAEAITGATFCRFPRNKLEILLDKYPKFEKRLLQTASNELAAAQDQMLLLGRKTAQERIASFLLNLSQRAMRRGQTGDKVDLPMSRADIGDYLGLTIETVSRTFTRLKKEEVIELPGVHEVAILDRAGLQDIAGFSAEDPVAAVARF